MTRCFFFVVVQTHQVLDDKTDQVKCFLMHFLVIKNVLLEGFL